MCFVSALNQNLPFHFSLLFITSKAAESNTVSVNGSACCFKFVIQLTADTVRYFIRIASPPTALSISSAARLKS